MFIIAVCKKAGRTRIRQRRCLRAKSIASSLPLILRQQLYILNCIILGYHLPVRNSENSNFEISAFGTWILQISTNTPPYLMILVPLESQRRCESGGTKCALKFARPEFLTIRGLPPVKDFPNRGRTMFKMHRKYKGIVPNCIWKVLKI
jgi:hypothetical protein